MININENHPVDFDQLFILIKDTSNKDSNDQYYLSSCEICLSHLDFIQKYISKNSYLKNWEQYNNKTLVSYINNHSFEYMEIASQQNLSIKFYD